MEPSHTPSNIKEWLECLVWFVGLILLFAALFKAFRGKPEPSEVAKEAAATFATKAELKDHLLSDDSIHSQLFGKITGAERGVEDRINIRLDKMSVDSMESRRNMHRDIDNIRADVAGVKTAITLTQTQLTRMDDKLDRLIERKSNEPNS